MVLQEFLDEWNNPSDTLSVQTSGSTGSPQTLQVEKKRMLASAKMTCDFLGLKAGDSALLCMSLNHIGAKMMVVRSIERALRLITVEPCGHPLRDVTETPDFAAMVPLQVFNSLQEPEEKSRLKQIRHLIIGGGAISDQMQQELSSFPHAVWSTYGMTETLSHIALRRLNGPTASNWYQPFPGVSLRLNDDDCLCIKAPLLCDKELLTNDRAIINNQGFFRILGRKDNIINSGGIKIQLEEVEQELHRLGLSNFALTGYPDEKFGEILVLLQTGSQENSCIINQLPKYWRPRVTLQTEAIPLTENGKIARQKVKSLVASLIDKHTIEK